MSKTWNVECLQNKRATSSRWASLNPILKAGEVGFDTTLNIFKIGDGTTAWNNLKRKYEPHEDLEKYTWAEINTISTSGLASKYFKVGDEKTIQLTTGETVTLVILDFSHDYLSGSSYNKAGITFGMKHLLATTYPMNSSNTNVGGWDQSIMRTSTMATLLNLLPSDLKSIIKTVSKKTSAGNTSSTITTSTDSLFLFSEIEVFGALVYSFTGEGEQYEYFKKYNPTNTSRIKKLSNGAGSANAWWLRSPRSSNSANFCGVGTSGYAISDGASYSRGVAFGFCI